MAQLTVNERGHYADSEDTFIYKIEDISSISNNLVYIFFFHKTFVLETKIFIVDQNMSRSYEKANNVLVTLTSAIVSHLTMSR